MTKQELQDLLLDLLTEEASENGTIDSVRSYAESGVMTRDAGLVVECEDREFQITIVRSR